MLGAQRHPPPPRPVPAPPLSEDGRLYAARHLPSIESAFTHVVQRLLAERPDSPVLVWAGHALIEYALAMEKFHPGVPSPQRLSALEVFQRNAAASRLQAQQRGKVARRHSLRSSTESSQGPERKLWNGPSAVAAAPPEEAAARALPLVALLLDEECVATLRMSYAELSKVTPRATPRGDGAATREELATFLPEFAKSMGWDGVTADQVDALLSCLIPPGFDLNRTLPWVEFASGLRRALAAGRTASASQLPRGGLGAAVRMEGHLPPTRMPRPEVSKPHDTVSVPTAPPVSEDDMSIEQILGTMRVVLQRRAEASHGISGGGGVLNIASQLARNFRICDRDHNGVLDVWEFSRCVAICRLGLHEKSVRRLHCAFDTDGSGTINYDEFLQALDPSESFSSEAPTMGCTAAQSAPAHEIPRPSNPPAAHASQLATELAAADIHLPTASGLSFDAMLDAASRETAPAVVPIPSNMTIGSAGEKGAMPLNEGVAESHLAPPSDHRMVSPSKVARTIESSGQSWPARPIVPRLHNLRERLRAADSPQPEPYTHPQNFSDDEDSEMDSTRSSVASSVAHGL